jgi:PilZ domain
VTENLFVVKRRVPRFTFVAEVISVRDGKRVMASISELSSKGCFLETPEELPEGAQLLLLIRFGGSQCDVTGKAIYKYEDSGMGVIFDELAAEQRSVLDGWLAQLARVVHGGPWVN